MILVTFGPIQTLDEFEEAVKSYLAAANVERKLAPASIRRKRATFRRFAAWWSGASILTDFRSPTEPPSSAKCLPGGVADVVKMIEKARRPHQRAVVALGGLCGLRVSESCAVAWDHFDTSNGVSLRVIGKGAKTRSVPVSDAAWGFLAPAYAAARSFPDDPRLVYVSEREARRAITSLGQRSLGIDLSSHDLRATFAQHVYEVSGHDLTLVQELLGHSDVETTRKYLRVRDSDKRRAVQI